MMKKLFTIATLLTISTTALAGFNDGNTNSNGGFTGQANLMSVTQALKARDNTYSTLEGTITQRLSDDDYLFQDNTGSIKAEIDDKVWRGQVVNPGDKIRISGKIDNDFAEKTKIDVKHLQKLN